MPAKKPVPTRANSDRHILYERSVQHVDSEIDFLDKWFTKYRGRKASTLREDFCGTAAAACEWVRRRPTNVAAALDLHAPTLAWARRHNLSKLPEEARSRVHLFQRDVTDPGSEPGLVRRVDIVEAMNFSWQVFHTRDALRNYFRSVHSSLVDDGVFFMDFYGGSDATVECTERRRIGGARTGFTYVWDQHTYEPLSGMMQCYIHFEFRQGPAWRRAFSYYWRVWTLPEVRELLAEAGFRTVTVFWEGDDAKGSGNGIFRPVTRGEACRAFISYITAQK